MLSIDIFSLCVPSQQLADSILLKEQRIAELMVEIKAVLAGVDR